MKQPGNQANANRPSRGGATTRARIQSLASRQVAALLFMLGLPVGTALAQDIPTASASVQQIAIADAQRYSQSPQLDLHSGRNTGPSAKSTSVTTITRKIAQMMVHTMWDNMRRKEETQGADAGSTSGYSTTYQLRLSDDRILLRMRRRF